MLRSSKKRRREAFLSDNCLGGRFEPVAGSLEGSSLTVETGVDDVPGLGAAVERFTPNISN